VKALPMQLKVSDCVAEAKDVVLLELRDPQERPLPAWAPGAHLEIALGKGLIRHYSLCGDPGDPGRYQIGVGRAANGRGGSSHLHQRVKVGDLLTVTAVRNNFAIVPNAAHYRFIAGGIGITPIMSMILWCESVGAGWSLLYCARSRHRAAFYERLAEWPRHVRYHFDDESGGRLPDIDLALAHPPQGEHVYCCGPVPLMQAVQSAGSFRPEGTVHFEWFSANGSAQPAATAEQGRRPFTLLLHRSGDRIEVSESQSMLEALEDHGIMVPSACREGMCRTCETSICSGQAEHHDLVLSQAERDAQQSVMLCVSRAVGTTLEIDL